MFEIISKQGLENLKYYKYAGEDHSLIVKYFLKRFWDWVITLFPLWVAPNVITLLGFICIIINFITLNYYAPNLIDGASPAWVYVSYAVGIFIYQVMDNIDGKQARRTNSSSPLGELFDHGCDSLFATISTITLCNAIQADTWQAFLMMNIGLFPFYLSHWEEYHSGILIMGTLGNPTEAQLLMIAVHLIAAFAGPTIYTLPLSQLLGKFGLSSIGSLIPAAFDIKLSWAMMAFSSFVSVGLVVLENFRVVYRIDKQQKKSFVASILLLVPFFIHISSCFTWFYISKAHILENHMILCIVFYGVVISYMLNRMIVDRITKIPHNPYNLTLPLPIIGLLSAIFGTAEQEETTLYVISGVLAVLYAHLVLTVINQLTTYLKINCFSIPYKPDNKKKN